MATFEFLCIWFVALVAGILAGCGTHYWHAFLVRHPDKLFEGYRWRDHLLNGALSSRYEWWADYDEDGWWEFYSLKNLAYHMIVPVGAAILFGLVFWSQRADVVRSVCRSLGTIGLSPLFCL